MLACPAISSSILRREGGGVKRRSWLGKGSLEGVPGEVVILLHVAESRRKEEAWITAQSLCTECA